MCRSAHDIQQYKYLVGFEEGDFVFADNKIRVVGHDFLSIKARHKAQGFSVFQCAMPESSGLKPTFDNGEFPMDDISVLFGRYRLKYIRNPVWLPRIDQLQHIVDVGNMQGVVHAVLRIKNDLPAAYWLSMISVERWWLSYVMMDQRDLYWTGARWGSFADMMGI